MLANVDVSRWTFRCDQPGDPQNIFETLKKRENQQLQYNGINIPVCA